MRTSFQCRFRGALLAVTLIALVAMLVACDSNASPSPTAAISTPTTTGTTVQSTPVAQVATPTAAGIKSTQPPVANNTVAPVSGRPRLILDAATLERLRAKASGGGSDSQWATLKGECDYYLGGSVEYPDGNDYPDNGSIGEGYQGDGYLVPLLNTGVCYQVALGVAPGDAAKYGAKAADILDKMSDPQGSPHWSCPLRDDGYGIRNYGIGLALGYDWAYNALSPDLRKKIYTALNMWLDWFEHGGTCPDGPQQDGGFGREHPQGNYFAGYYAAKGLMALSTEGDNPEAAAQWTSWLNMHKTMVQPYYAANMKGGGWPEGWNYGPLGTFNMILPVLAARTAKGIDLVHDQAAPFTFPLETGLNLIQFSWPNRLSLDDRGALYGQDNPARTPAYLYSVLAGALQIWNDPSAPIMHSFASEVRKAQGETANAWQDFVFWEEGAPDQDFKTLPLSYFASGMGTVAMRSSWDTDAVWGSFTSGPYVDYPGAGEQYYDQGSLAIVRGGKPLLANAIGSLLRNIPGQDDGSSYEGAIYDDLYGNNDANPDLENRTLFNIFYVKAGHYGQISAEPTDAKTHINLYADGGPYVYAQGTNLEDMYRLSSDATTPLVGSWTREMVYLRPQTFVLYDRTSVPTANADQWMAFHFEAKPAEATAASDGTYLFEIGDGANYRGSVTSLLPAGNKTETVNVLNSNKVYRLEVRPNTPGSDQRWLTVFDAAASAGDAAQATPLTAEAGNVLSGDSEGALLHHADANQVVLFASSANASASGTLSYKVPAAPTTHLIANLTPKTAYAVSASVSNGNVTVTIAPGSGFTTDDAGLLYVATDADGKVTAGR